MMKLLALVFCCFFVAQANVIKSETQREWQKFMATYKKSYSSDVETEFRFKIFKDNLEKIAKHNKDFEDGKTTYTMALNHFADLLPSEFAEKMTGLKKIDTKRQLPALKEASTADLPDSFDWREKGAVTPVKDQGSCGSCWAFSTTGSLEGAHFLKTGELVSLSEQNLVDCSRDYGNYGCGGGWMDSGFQYIIDNGGIDTEESYPYEAADGQCRFNKDTIGSTEAAFVDLPAGDEATLQETVATVGPVSVAINANMNFQFYSGGVFKDASCSPNYLNHGVLAVGYGVEDGQDYWLVKNSWGESWGEAGYIKMARNYNNMCGITQVASYPTL